MRDAAADDEHRILESSTAWARAWLPPVAGRGERFSARLRNAATLFWALYLVVLLAWPAAYDGSMAVLDRLLWPVVKACGRVGTVALIAAALAAATMLGQRILTDNARLREAKRRAGRLQRKLNSWRLAMRRADPTWPAIAF